MRNIIAIIAICFGLAACEPAPVKASLPEITTGRRPAMVGTIVGDPYACIADSLSTQVKADLTRWIELRGKFGDGTMIEAEFLESEQLNAVVGGPCGALPSGLPVVVLLTDGLDYLVAGPDGNTFVIKAEGFVRDND